MNEQALTQLTAAALPWLVLTVCGQSVAGRLALKWRGWQILLLSGAVAALILLLPIGGLSIASRIAGVSANFSITFIGLLAVSVWERAVARRICTDGDWRMGWGFGAIGGVVLYPMALGLGSVDPYEWGWQFGPLFVAMGVLTAWLFWKGYRFGLLLLIAAAAFHLRLLESTNYWDYLIDPVYVLVAIIAMARRLTSQVRDEVPLPREVP
jgi:hypothetical protein